MVMKVSYVIAVLIFALGLGLLIWGTASTDEVTLLGVTFHPRLAKGVGYRGCGQPRDGDRSIRPR
jgi:hypothetical protein